MANEYKCSECGQNAKHSKITPESKITPGSLGTWRCVNPLCRNKGKKTRVSVRRKSSEKESK